MWRVLVTDEPMCSALEHVKRVLVITAETKRVRPLPELKSYFFTGELFSFGFELLGTVCGASVRFDEMLDARALP